MAVGLKLFSPFGLNQKAELPCRCLVWWRRQSFRITGIVHSPEFIFTSRIGIPLPDNRCFLILWGNQDAVARAFDIGASDRAGPARPGLGDPYQPGRYRKGTRRFP
ncbi:MAG: hypothetical protein INF79_13960 [Roseomonas sp.]|nr:hypothetical protein [Roseomonas sp.]